MKGRPWWVSGLQFAGVGWYMATAIVLGTLGGWWLDRQAGTAPLLLLLGLALGLTVGFYGIYRMTTTLTSGQRRPRSEREPRP